MKIAINFTASPDQGGVYQYSVSFLECLAKIPNNKYLVIGSKSQIPKKFLSNQNFRIVSVGKKTLLRNFALLFDYFIFRLLPQAVGRRFYKRLYPILTTIHKINHSPTIKLLNKLKPDLILEPVSTGMSILTDIPTVVAIHDIEHRIRPQFKEISANGIWENREYLYSNITRRAYKILVDSEVGKEDIMRSYRVPSEKIVILPFLPPSYLKPKLPNSKLVAISKKNNLPQDYLFYPAKFWPHKNHLNLVKALKILHRQGLTNLHLVFTGTKTAEYSTYQKVFLEVKKQNLTNHIHFLGYLNGTELSVTYKKSQALVMPTFLGPTNIPVYEAWLMGIPVIYSNIRGPKQQLGSAGLLIDPKSPRSIAKQIKKLYGNKKLRRILVNRGYRRLRAWTPAKFSARLKQIIVDFNRTHA